jgi:hypothetical protein
MICCVLPITILVILQFLFVIGIFWGEYDVKREKTRQQSKRRANHRNKETQTGRLKNSFIFLKKGQLQFQTN